MPVNKMRREGGEETAVTCFRVFVCCYAWNTDWSHEVL